jgi:hsp70-interacting protein
MPTNLTTAEPTQDPTRLTETDLLAWGVLNSATISPSSPSTEPSAPLKPIDSKWLDIIMGKSESVQMRECITLINDLSLTLEGRLAMFDKLEMMVESLDNANDLLTLGLWYVLTCG